MAPIKNQIITKEFIDSNVFTNPTEEEIDRDIFLQIGTLIRQESARRAVVAAAEAEAEVVATPLEPPAVDMQRVVDSAVHLLGSKQDIVHTVHRVFEDTEEWFLAVMDGHGSVMSKNPFTGKMETHNFTLLVIQEMIANGELDRIMTTNIYSENDPAVLFQRYLSEKCVQHKHGMTHVGATFSLVQIIHDSTLKKVFVHVLAVGDSPVTIHCNGEKVLESVAHNTHNEEDMARLRREGRLNSKETSPSNTFKLLDSNTLVAEPAAYANVGPCLLSVTQSLGHIEYIYGGDRVIDEKGIFGLAPFKKGLVFDDTDDLNIKAYSDGVSDVITDYLPQDMEFLKKSNARETADFAKYRWQREWNAVAKTAYDAAIQEGKTLADVPKSSFSFKSGADDVSCVSWIQSKKTA